MSGLRIIEPLGYLDFLHLMGKAAVVLTDSGGIQEETTILGVWCLTVREHRTPVTLNQRTYARRDRPAAHRVEYRRCRSQPAGTRPIPENGTAKRPNGSLRYWLSSVQRDWCLATRRFGHLAISDLEPPVTRGFQHLAYNWATGRRRCASKSTVD